MKGNLRLTILMLVLLVGSLQAGQPPRTLILAWDASPGLGVRYRLYYGEVSGQYTVVLDTGIATSASVGGLKPGQLYYFAATAVNEWGESAFSHEISARGRP